MTDSGPGGARRAPAVPRLEIDELLGQLVARAEDVLVTQSRLRGLLEANLSINGDLSLPDVLRRIVTAACRLSGARYGAVGVLDTRGGLSDFIQVGMDDDAIAAIGRWPEGKGLLGALIQDPRPIRLRRITDDSRSVGFPPGHPPMGAFLGVPIRIRDTVFGNLYLTEPAAGEFSADDEEIVTALAATAGIAVENARLYEQEQRRRRWLQASVEVTRSLLSAGGEEPLDAVARAVNVVAGADFTFVVLPAADNETLMIEVAVGAGTEDLVGFAFNTDSSISGDVTRSGRAVLVADAGEHSHGSLSTDELKMDVGPVMAVPLVGERGTRGVLTIARRAGGPLFDQQDLELATSFANHAALALELADARAYQQRMILLEDRHRIAGELHDHVLQRLFAGGMSMQAIAAVVGEPHAERLEQLITDTDETIVRIRSVIHGLNELGPLPPTS